MDARKVSTGVYAMVCASVMATVIYAGTVSAEPPGIPNTTAARRMLHSLTVSDEHSMSGYSREKFPHWSRASGECSIRETVLQRDGTGVHADAKCHITAGTWHSPYDGKTVTDSSDVHIDHVVPLAEAWRSGARQWNTSQREKFANDLADPQLIAVTASSNRQKGDRDPSQWLPPSLTYRCTYAEMWIAVKWAWHLTIHPNEKDALSMTLKGC
ncbi:HNH endonuclease family protein [Nocardia terpenica]|nr:HNH endonuclease family protein [Nocardia terpenica]